MVADKPWKSFERAVARLFDGRRFWSNSGEEIDVEGPLVVAQCKQVRVLSLAALTRLAVRARRDGVARGKVGVVAVKLRAGRGVGTPTLVVLHEDSWRDLHGERREATTVVQADEETA